MKAYYFKGNCLTQQQLICSKICDSKTYDDLWCKKVLQGILCSNMKVQFNTGKTIATYKCDSQPEKFCNEFTNTVDNLDTISCYCDRSQTISCNVQKDYLKDDGGGY